MEETDSKKLSRLSDKELTEINNNLGVYFSVRGGKNYYIICQKFDGNYYYNNGLYNNRNIKNIKFNSHISQKEIEDLCETRYYDHNTEYNFEHEHVLRDMRRIKNERYMIRIRILRPYTTVTYITPKESNLLKWLKSNKNLDK
jgi:hypothetical protein